MNTSMAAAAGQSLNERAFILQALGKSNLRIDGRGPHDMRPIRLSFGRGPSTSFSEVQLGRTRVRVVVTSEIVRPYPDRPVEGFLSFNVDSTSLAASSSGKTQRTISERRAVHLTTIVENGIREARAIDTEALCIVAGEKAWSIHCEIHVLDDGGNIVDATCFATIAALRHFRRPEITVNDGVVIEHPSEDRVPVALSVRYFSSLCPMLFILLTDV
jgi:exosome complex component RRP45